MTNEQNIRIEHLKANPLVQVHGGIYAWLLLNKKDGEKNLAKKNVSISNVNFPMNLLLLNCCQRHNSRISSLYGPDSTQTFSSIRTCIK